ncbi:MAG: hypothetical protein ABIM40_01900 [Pseudomonadota bacterium]
MTVIKIILGIIYGEPFEMGIDDAFEPLAEIIAKARQEGVKRISP